MLRPNTMKAKLQQGLPAVGISLTFPSPHLVEVAAYCGFDWVLLDCEHGSMTPESVEVMAMAAELAGIVPIVRPPTNAPHELLRYLDRGCMGVQVPHVSTAQQARAAAEAVRYFPQGHRGLAAGALRAATFGMRATQAEWVEWVNRESLVCVQIEDPEGVRNLDAILEVAGVDVFFLGANDLSAAMGYATQAGHPEVKKVVDAALARIHAAGKTSGGSGSPAALAAYRRQGVRYLYTHVPTVMRLGAAQALAQALEG